MREIRRAELVAAIGRPCRYCGEPMTAPTRDHIRPRSKGGTLEPGNKALVCDTCNGDKGSCTLGSWLYRLQKAGDRRAAQVAVFLTAVSAIQAIWMPGLSPGILSESCEHHPEKRCRGDAEA